MTLEKNVNKLIQDVSFALTICQSGEDAARYILCSNGRKRTHSLHMDEVATLIQCNDIIPAEHNEIDEGAIYENVIEIGLNNVVLNAIVSSDVNTDGNFAYLDPLMYGDLTIAEAVDALIDMRKQGKRHLMAVRNRIRLLEKREDRVSPNYTHPDIEYKSLDALREIDSQLSNQLSELKCVINYMCTAVVAHEDYRKFVLENEKRLAKGDDTISRTYYYNTNQSMLGDIRRVVRKKQKLIHSVANVLESYGCEVIYRDMDSIIIIPSDSPDASKYLRELRDDKNALDMPTFDIMDADNAVLSRNGFIRTWDAKVRNKSELVPTVKLNK